MPKNSLRLSGLVLIANLSALPQQLPIFSATGPDAPAYGAAEHFPVGSPANFFEQKYMVGSFSHFDLLFPAQGLAPAAQPWQFQRPASPPEIGYAHAHSHFSIQDYLTHLPITGLLIAKDDQILFEAYQYARTDHDRFTSQSMAKSIVSMLMGIALSEQTVSSVSDTAEKYVPELKDTAYGHITIRDLLHMSSGMSCQAQRPGFESISLQMLAHDCKSAAPAGTHFAYSAADSQLLGLILTRANKKPLAHYLDEKLWRNIGAEASASWTIDSSDQQTAFCCFNAVLRDYGRFARLLAFDGAWNGKQLIPQQWLIDATTLKDSDTQLQPGQSTRFFGYGYQIWIFPGPRRMFGLLGANGQRIFIDPESKLIMVQTAVMLKDMDPQADAEMIGLWLSLVRHFGGQ